MRCSAPCPRADAARTSLGWPTPARRPGQQASAQDDLRKRVRPAPQERLVHMVDLNEERTAQILRKWAGREAA